MVSISFILSFLKYFLFLIYFLLYITQKETFHLILKMVSYLAYNYLKPTHI